MNAVDVEARFEDAIESALLAGGWLAGPASYSTRARPGYVRAGHLHQSDAAGTVPAADRAHGGTESAAARTGEAGRGPDRRPRGAGRPAARREGPRRHDQAGVLPPQPHPRPGRARPVPGQPARRSRAQFHYSAQDPAKSVDLALFLNGIPVATAELKNPAKGQTVEDAKQQYRTARDPKELIFARRTLVHFAVDPDLAFITTRLAGAKTRFLPFNTGLGRSRPPRRRR